MYRYNTWREREGMYRYNTREKEKACMYSTILGERRKAELLGIYM